VSSVPGFLAAVLLGLALIAADVTTWVGAYLYWPRLSLLFKVLFVVGALAHLGLGALWLFFAYPRAHGRRPAWPRLLGATALSTAILAVMLRELLAVHRAS